MVCEPLGKSLYDYIKENDYVGFPLHIVRDVSRYKDIYLYNAALYPKQFLN